MSKRVYELGAQTNASGAYVLEVDEPSGSIPETQKMEINSIMPTGSVIDYAGLEASIPSGWIKCDGSAISRITYARLFSIIGTKFGVGDGSTTFNLPNTGGRVVVGATGDNLVAIPGSDNGYGLSQTYGSDRKNIVASQIPTFNVYVRMSSGSNNNGMWHDSFLHAARGWTANDGSMEYYNIARYENTSQNSLEVMQSSIGFYKIIKAL